MVSKTLICVFVALCCAQAFASAVPEISALKSQNVGFSSVCKEKLRGIGPLLEDAASIAFDYALIFISTRIRVQDCFNVEGTTVDEIIACKKDAYDKKLAALIKENSIAIQKAENAFEVIQIIVAECL